MIYNKKEGGLVVEATETGLRTADNTRVKQSTASSFRLRLRARLD